jgi:hypothetical protein
MVCHYVVGEVPIQVRSCEGREAKDVPKPQENTRVLEPPLTCKTTLFLLGPTPTGTGTIALDPTFGSFTLLEPVSYHVNYFL